MNMASGRSIDALLCLAAGTAPSDTLSARPSLGASSLPVLMNAAQLDAEGIKLSGKPYFKLAKLEGGKVATLDIDGVIGGEYDFWTGIESGKSSTTFKQEIKALGAIEQLNLNINSPGGIGSEGVEINLRLQELKAAGVKIVAKIGSLCASAATVVACAADEVQITDLSAYMIHDGFGGVSGPVEKIRAYVDYMEVVNASALTAYTAKNTKMTADEIKAAMKAETWYSGAEAVEAGFADTLVNVSSITACADMSLVNLERAPDHIKALLMAATPPEGDQDSNTDPVDPANVPPAPTDAAAEIADLKQQVETLSAVVTALNEQIASGNTPEPTPESTPEPVVQVDVKSPAVMALKSFATMRKQEAEFDAAVAAGADLPTLRTMFLTAPAPKVEQPGLLSNPVDVTPPSPVTPQTQAHKLNALAASIYASRN